MKTKQIWSNLGVSDIERTTRFYSTLGFTPNSPHNSTELASFLVGDTNFVMHFFLKEKLKDAVHGELADLSRGCEVMFTLSAGSQPEVDEWAKEVQKAGGTLVSEPEESGEGYYGFVFTDPDGHKFNMFYM